MNLYSLKIQIQFRKTDFFWLEFLFGNSIFQLLIMINWKKFFSLIGWKKLRCLMSFIDSFIKKNQKESDDHSEDEIIETSEIKEKQEETTIKHITKEGYLLYREKRTLCQLTEKQLKVKSQNRVVDIDLKSIFAIHIELTVLLIFCFDLKKQQKYVLRLDGEEKKVSNEWLFSIQRNVFGLTKEISKRRILFFLNPEAGVKKAEENFYKIAKPIFDVAHISYETYVSKNKGDITAYVKKLDLSEFDEFCAVGGDGTVNFKKKILI